MKFAIQLISIALISLLLQLFLPWWCVIVVAFTVALVMASKSGSQTFLAGFLAIFLLWVGYAMIIDINSGSILTDKIARILTINDKYLLIAVTGLIGGIPSGFGALSGNMLGKLFKKEKSSQYYS